jgi:multidrug efflux pump subunit AcrA (membrane-fusion protein)
LVGEESQSEKRYLQAMAVGTPAEVRILAARKEQLKAQRELADEQLLKMRVLAPHDGVIASGDLSQSIGSPLERGQVVYSLAPLEDFRVILEVPDSEIDECAVGQEGVIVLTAMPDREISIKIERLTPVSSAKEGLNYFRVEAALLEETDSNLFRPGMEGVGKVAVGRRGLLWTWTHSALDTMRLLIWKWTP